MFTENAKNELYSNLATSKLVRLTDTKQLMCFRLSSDNYGRAVVLTISGTTVSPGTNYPFTSTTITAIDCVALSETKFLITYNDTSDLYSGYAIVATVNLDTNGITFGTACKFYTRNGSATAPYAVTALSATSVAFAYENLSDKLAYILPATIDEYDTITLGTSVQIHPSATDPAALSIITLTSTTGVANFIGTSNFQAHFSITNNVATVIEMVYTLPGLNSATNGLFLSLDIDSWFQVYYRSSTGTYTHMYYLADDEIVYTTDNGSLNQTSISYLNSIIFRNDILLIYFTVSSVPYLHAVSYSLTDHTYVIDKATVLSAGYGSISKIDDDSILHVFIDTTNSNYGTAVVLTFDEATYFYSNTSIGTVNNYHNAYANVHNNLIQSLNMNDDNLLLGYAATSSSYRVGSNKIIDSSTTSWAYDQYATTNVYFPYLVALSTTKALLLTYTTSYEILGYALTLDSNTGTVTSIGSSLLLSTSGKTSYSMFSCVRLNDTQSLLAYADSTPAIKAVVITESAGSLSLGSVQTVASVDGDSVYCIGLSSSTVMCSYMAYDNKMYSVVLSISGTNISVNTIYNFLSYTPYSIRGCLIDTNKVLLSLADFDTNVCNVVIATIDTYAISYGTPVFVTNIPSSDSIQCLAAKYSESEAILLYRKYANSKYYCTIAIATIDDTNITISSELDLFEASTYSMFSYDIVKVTANNFIIAVQTASTVKSFYMVQYNPVTMSLVLVAQQVDSCINLSWSYEEL